jgi:hypothetical protein
MENGPIIGRGPQGTVSPHRTNSNNITYAMIRRIQKPLNKHGTKI